MPQQQAEPARHCRGRQGHRWGFHPGPAQPAADPPGDCSAAAWTAAFGLQGRHEASNGWGKQASHQADS